MGDSYNYPVLVPCKELRPELENEQEICINSDRFSIGRSSENSLVVSDLSRHHCMFKRIYGDLWHMKVKSTHGLKINGIILRQGDSPMVCDGDILTLDKAARFVYKFTFNKDACEMSSEYNETRSAIKNTNSTAIATNSNNNANEMFEKPQSCDTMPKKVNSFYDAREIPNKRIKVEHPATPNNTVKSEHIENNKAINNEVSQTCEMVQNKQSYINHNNVSSDHHSIIPDNTQGSGNTNNVINIFNEELPFKESQPHEIGQAEENQTTTNKNFNQKQTTSIKNKKSSAENEKQSAITCKGKRQSLITSRNKKTSSSNIMKKKRSVTTTVNKKQSNVKIKQIQSDLSTSTVRFIGGKTETNMQTALEEKSAELNNFKAQMETNKLQLTDQMKKLNERVEGLIKENTKLKETMMKEKQEFSVELSQVMLSNQDIMKMLITQFREHEQIKFKYQQEALDTLKREIEKVKCAKEKEIKEARDQKMKLEEELKSLTVYSIEKTLESECDQLELDKIFTERMQFLNNEYKIETEKLRKEKDDLENRLNEMQSNYIQVQEDLMKQVSQHQAEVETKSLEKVSALQVQLNQATTQLQEAERERDSFQERLSASAASSRQAVQAELEDVFESELQCSICVELFVDPVILNCSHTFCHYCITMCRSNSGSFCPLCRVNIVTMNKNLILNTLIEKMVASLSDEMKRKRREMLEIRRAETVALLRRVQGLSRSDRMVATNDRRHAAPLSPSSRARVHRPLL